ncbi:hypothetical protein, partial [Salmonella sp. s51228]|uniref:hypothetical protein n=1 Tax=Salmonella sp. s51228 TaxID=3159652 RepID=UPI00397E9482
DKSNDKLKQVTESLSTAQELPQLGRDSASIIWKRNTMDVSKQNVNSQLAAMLAATASVLTLTRDAKEVDHTAVGSAITTISSNLMELSKSAKMLAALLAYEGQDGSNLLKAAQNLANATSKFLQQSKPPFTGHHKTLLDAAGAVGASGGNLLLNLGELDV